MLHNIVQKFLIIQQIVYTGHNNNGNITNGLYTIDFVLKNRLNNEKTTNCRLELVWEVCDKMLDRIDIRYNNEFIKTYQFCYETNDQKILLKELMEIDQSCYSSQGKVLWKLEIEASNPQIWLLSKT